MSKTSTTLKMSALDDGGKFTLKLPQNRYSLSVWNGDISGTA
jgi:hypothetical protein